jgi:hypothetical protein
VNTPKVVPDYPFSSFENLGFSSNPHIEAWLKNRKLVSIQSLGSLETNTFITSGFLCGEETKMIKDPSCDDVKRKRERNEVCLNCRNYVSCHHIAEYEECLDFEEVENEVWTIERMK